MEEPIKKRNYNNRTQKEAVILSEWGDRIESIVLSENAFSLDKLTQFICSQCTYLNSAHCSTFHLLLHSIIYAILHTCRHTGGHPASKTQSQFPVMYGYMDTLCFSLFSLLHTDTQRPLELYESIYDIHTMFLINMHFKMFTMRNT